jgi:hypothetical protein
MRALRIVQRAAAVMALAALGACASDDGYSGYGGGDVDVVMSYGYYGGGYYPYYYPGYPCCWYDNDGRPIEIPPGERPDRPTTLPATPGQLPAERPTTRPAPATRPSPSMSRPAPRPTPAPRPMGGGGRRR